MLGSEVIEEMNQTRKLFSDNLDRLLSYKISNSGLQLEIKQLGALAKNGINISNMKIDDDTFPNINHNVRNDIIKLERQIVSLNYQGLFLNIGRFIESIKESESNLQMQYCSFNLDSLDPRGVIAQMEYSTYGGSRLKLSRKYDNNIIAFVVILTLMDGLSVLFPKEKN